MNCVVVYGEMPRFSALRVTNEGFGRQESWRGDLVSFSVWTDRCLSHAVVYYIGSSRIIGSGRKAGIAWLLMAKCLSMVPYGSPIRDLGARSIGLSSFELRQNLTRRNTRCSLESCLRFARSTIMTRGLFRTAAIIRKSTWCKNIMYCFALARRYAVSLIVS